jgi:hypothetical protein
VSAVSGVGNQNPRPSLLGTFSKAVQDRRIDIVSPLLNQDIKKPSGYYQVCFLRESLKPSIIQRFTEPVVEARQCGPRNKLAVANY